MLVRKGEVDFNAALSLEEMCANENKDSADASGLPTRRPNQRGAKASDMKCEDIHAT